MALAVSAGVLLAGCGGGGDSPQASAAPSSPDAPVTALAWTPPTVYADNTAMDPYQDLDYYEFYVGSDPSFTDNDAPVAQVQAVTNITGPDGQTLIPRLTSEFHLNNLLPFTRPGAAYYVSIRAVGIGGLKSQFSVPVLWDLGNA